MRRFSRSACIRLWIALTCIALNAMCLLAQVSLRSVKVLGGKDAVEIEVEASDRIVPQAQVLSGPDRLVLDFANAVPGNQLRSQSVDRGDVKAVRVGLFQAKPPVTRVVLDLKSARSYQIFPSGRTVVIKLNGGSTPSEDPAVAYEAAKRPGYVATNYITKREPVQIAEAPKVPLEVTFRDGLLSIVANKATLSEVLYAVQQRTGADISIPAGAEQERVVAEFEPGPAPEVLARLLNGSRFNFLILSSPTDPQRLDRVVLSPRDEGNPLPLMPVQNETAQAPQDDTDGQPAIAPPPRDVAAAPPQPEPDSIPNPANDGSPDK